jgi:hypothetical protein
MFGYRILVQITNSRVPSTVLARSTSPSPAEGNRLLHVLRCRARLIACGRRTAGSHPAGHCPSERRHLAEAAPGARRRRDPIGRGERRHLAPFHTATMLSLSRVAVLLLSTTVVRAWLDIASQPRLPRRHDRVVAAPGDERRPRDPALGAPPAVETRPRGPGRREPASAPPRSTAAATCLEKAAAAGRTYRHDDPASASRGLGT